MGVTCQILIKNTKDGGYKPGQTVQGLLKYSIDKPTKYKDINLTFNGKGRCIWQKTVLSRVITYVGREKYVKEIVTFRNQDGDFFILQPGNYEFPFSFKLPLGVPGSYTDTTCQIFYILQVKFEKPFLSGMNENFVTEIKVKHIEPTEKSKGKVFFGLDKQLFRPMSSKQHNINLKTEMSDSVFLPGQTIELNYVVKNDTDVTISTVKAELIEHRLYKADNDKEMKKEKVVKGCVAETPAIAINAVANMENSITIPTGVFSVENSKMFKRTFKVRVTVKLPLPYMDDKVEYPIRIVNQIGDDDDDDDDKLEEATSVDQPPSYKEDVMSTSSKDIDD